MCCEEVWGGSGEVWGRSTGVWEGQLGGWEVSDSGRGWVWWRDRRVEEEI